MNAIMDSLSNPAVVVLRRLRGGPLTEFEMARAVSESFRYSSDQAADQLIFWLQELFDMGLVWYGVLSNACGQNMLTAALTKLGKELAGVDDDEGA